MKERSREEWLRNLKVNDPVMERKTTVVLKEKYIEDMDEQGFLIGERWYEPDGTSGKGLFTSYDIIPVTPETSRQLQHRQAANYMQGVHWSMFSLGDLQKMIEVVQSMNREEREKEAANVPT